MKKGQTLEFSQLRSTLQFHKDSSKWRLIATGGTYWYLNYPFLYKYDFRGDYFDFTEGGTPCFSLVAREDGKDVANIPFGGYDDLIYRIEVYNEHPLEILIDWREKYEDGDSQFLILQQVL